MKTNNHEYPAVPLITCDPNFSVWSFSDKLYEDHTRHWTGSQQSLTGIITVDGVSKTFMGKLRHNPLYNSFGPAPIEQKSLEVTPLKTIYTFTDEKIELKLTFMTPLIPSDLLLMSRPVSYISYTISSLDKKEHACTVYIDASALLAVNQPDESVVIEKSGNKICCGRGTNDILCKGGDDRRINWGYLHIASPNGKTGAISDGVKNLYFHFRNSDATDDLLYHPIKVSEKYPAIYCVNEYTVKNSVSDFVVIGYDDIHSLEYFGKQIDCYYKKDGANFSEIFQKSIDEYTDIVEKVDKFDAQLITRAEEISKDYAKIVSISFRQAIAAHKLAWDGEEGVFVSKECFSNGCAATVDVTYPSIPLFLIYNPQLVEYMLNPIFKLIDKGLWPFDFAPHDAGTYPLVNGQVYGVFGNELQYENQMPIEECGNMILCVAAICRCQHNTDFAEKHFDVLNKWAEYLIKFGFDPENQLCTDDFAGHLAHNCNLSVKAIVGIAAWGMLLDMLGKKDEAKKYTNEAKAYAAKWKTAAFEKDHYRLAFDREDSWSIKYNLVWDKLFGLNIFDNDIFDTEVKYYMKKIAAYGLPLDCRSSYTKSDWQLWSTVLSDNKEYTDAIVSAMLKMLSGTFDRVPFSDWYYTDDARQVSFQNRTVQGGLFIKLLNI